MAQVPSSCKVCDSCNKQKGVVYCYNCKFVLCSACQDMHKKFPATSQHKVKKYHERTVLKNAVKDDMCSDHDQDFAYFCQDCSCLVCQECPVTTHKGHTLNQLKDIAAKTRKELQKNISKKQDSIAKLSALISNVEIDNMSFIRDECEKFKTSVKKIRDQLHETIDLICDEYIKSATDCFDLEKASLELSLKKLRKQHAQYTDVIAEMTRLSAEEYDPLLLVQHKSLPEVLDSLEAIPSGVSTPEGQTPISAEDVILKIAKEVKSTR